MPDWLRNGLIGVVNKVIGENLDPDALASAPMGLDLETIAKIFYICYQARGPQKAGRCRCVQRRKGTYDTQYSVCLGCQMPVDQPGQNTVFVEALVDQVFEKRLKACHYICTA